MIVLQSQRNLRFLQRERLWHPECHSRCAAVHESAEVGCHRTFWLRRILGRCSCRRTLLRDQMGKQIDDKGAYENMTFRWCLTNLDASNAHKACQLLAYPSAWFTR